MASGPSRKNLAPTSPWPPGTQLFLGGTDNSLSVLAAGQSEGSVWREAASQLATLADSGTVANAFRLATLTQIPPMPSAHRQRVVGVTQGNYLNRTAGCMTSHKPPTTSHYQPQVSRERLPGVCRDAIGGTISFTFTDQFS